MKTMVVISFVMACAAVCTSQDYKTHHQHVIVAEETLKTELAKQGKDCIQAQSQYEDTACSAQVARAADQSLVVFFENLKAILPSDAQSTLQDTQQAWLNYRKKACEAVFEFYKDGTIRNSEQARCEIRLIRQRMQDLDFLYYGPLHR